ncbi:MAG: cation transporter [Gemmatimonadota bacterium]
MDTKTIAISGMSCGHCVTAVTKALNGVSGVVVQDVRIGSATVGVESEGALAAAESAISDAGYDVVKGRTLNVASPAPEA